MKTERLSNWEMLLHEYLMEKRDQPFKWGVNDCCTFSAGAVEAMTGVNPMEEFVGKYKSAATSHRALIDIGSGDLEQTLDAKFKECPIGFAHTGDLAFFDGSVGVIIGGDAVFVTEDGLYRVNRLDWTKAWMVGRDG